MIKRLIINLMIYVYVPMRFAEATTPTKCYVCGKGAEEPFEMPSIKTGPNKYNFSSCENFDKSLSHENFIYECPTGYVGCLTQITGNDVMRTCDLLQINDCQTANNVKYCYCDKDLCNGKDIKTLLPMHGDHRNYLPNSDDEDLIDEASGMGDLQSNDEDDEGGDEDEFEHDLNRAANTGTENLNHIDLSAPLWTTHATDISINENYNFGLTTTTENSTSLLANATTKSQSSKIFLANINLNLVLLLVMYIFLIYFKSNL